MKNDLGTRVHQHLTKMGIETPFEQFSATPSVKQGIEHHYGEIMKLLGLNLDDDSLADTPGRIAKMYCEEIFYGLSYDNFPKCTSIENKMRYDEMISQRCTVMSVCEHHAVPFMGVAFVAYVPSTKVIGLSKMNRIVDFFSRRPQVQERLTAQICETLKYVLKTEDVAVVVQAEHLCVKLRGVKDSQSYTTTSKMSGKFMNVPSLRAEFLALTRK
jgi:GTP cyclohydrolase I